MKIIFNIPQMLLISNLRKMTFWDFLKKNTDLSVFHQNKPLHTFLKRGQRSIARHITELDKGLGGNFSKEKAFHEGDKFWEQFIEDCSTWED